jgi:hypothetical protein
MFTGDEELAYRLQYGCLGTAPDGELCSNPPNEGYDLCEACYRRKHTCAACGFTLMQSCCINLRCPMREGASYEEMMQFQESEREKRAANAYVHSTKEEFYDVCKATKDDNTCAICLEDFVTNEPVVRLNCGGKHAFHAECADKGFKMTGICCPTCNLPIPKKKKAKLSC